MEIFEINLESSFSGVDQAFRCDGCGTIYDSLAKAVRCEASHLLGANKKATNLTVKGGASAKHSLNNTALQAR